MRREWTVFQSFWHIEPTQAILMQDERRVAWNRIESFRADLRLVIGSFSLYKPGNVNTGPFFRIPPHKFLPFAPRLAVRSGTGAVVNNSAIARPCESPTVAAIIFRFPRVGFIDTVAAKNAGINPAAGRSRPVGLQFRETI